MEEVGFRPTLNKLDNTWEMQKLVINMRKRMKINRNYIKKKDISCGIRHPLSRTPKEAMFVCKESISAYMLMKQNTGDMIYTFLLE